MNLTDEQNKIVNLSEKVHLVLAPPGTGKTEILSQRINCALERYMLPEDMLCLTFTNRAAKSMKERVRNQFGETGVFIGNIHTFCLHFLKENHQINNATMLLDEDEAKSLYREALKNISENFEEHYWKYENIENYNSYGEGFYSLKEDATKKFQIQSKNFFTQTNGNYDFDAALHKAMVKIANSKIYQFPEECLQSSFYESKNFKDAFISKDDYEKGIGYFLNYYIKLKEEINGVDFDDLLGMTNSFIKSNKVNRKVYKWIQIDEVQDLNPVQWEIVKSISDNNSHIVYFGDYEQAIYSFLDAKLENLHEIEKNAEVHNFTKNFRSPDFLLNYFVKYCRTFLNPKWKKDPTHNSSIEKEKISLCFRHIDGTVDTENDFLVNKILPNLPEDENKAILVRTNKQADELGYLLDNSGIDYFKISGLDIMKYYLTKTVLAIMFILNNKSDRASWIRIFYSFSNFATLKESRDFVVKCFSLGFQPVDFLTENYFVLEDFKNMLQYERIIVFDTETTGLDTENDDIIQIAAVEIINGKICREFNQYILTEKFVGETVDIHKITDEYLLENGINKKIAFQNFINFVGESPLIAHNLKYDKDIIKSNFEKIGLKLNDKISYFDSIDLAKRIYPNLPNYKLEFLLKTLQVEGVNSHNAIDDVKATANVLFNLFENKDEYFASRKKFLQDNRNTIKTFRNKFKDFYSELSSDINTDNTLSFLFKKIGVFCAHSTGEEIPRDVYKITDFMDFISEKDIISKNLEKHINDFATYKESDLITGKEKIIISTIHKAKGLEFHNVIIPGCYNNNYPFYYAVNSGDQSKLDEEARLFYVAMSRSQKRLIFTSPTKNIKRGSYIEGKYILDDLQISNYVSMFHDDLDWRMITQ